MGWRLVITHVSPQRYGLSPGPEARTGWRKAGENTEKSNKTLCPQCLCGEKLGGQKGITGYG